VESVETKLGRIARKARDERALRFVNLFHLLKAELLRECFEGLRGKAAPGIDGVTKAEYAETILHNSYNLTLA